MKSFKVIMIGAGNVGYHLAKRFHARNFEIAQVFSRTEEHAVELAQLVGAKPVTDLSRISKNANFYCLAVPDDKIRDVVAQIRVKKGLVVHTSGSVSSEVLRECSPDYGVFYPLQTFSRNTRVNWNKIPVIIYSNQLKITEQLELIGDKTGKYVLMLNDEERQYLHLSAVFINNFTNHMGVIAKDILDQKMIDFELLKPLMQETVAKLFKGDPYEMQTGPAKRGDDQVIEKHLEMLEGLLHYKEVYRMVSGSIMKRVRQGDDEHDNEIS